MARKFNRAASGAPNDLAQTPGSKRPPAATPGALIYPNSTAWLSTWLSNKE